MAAGAQKLGACCCFTYTFTQLFISDISSSAEPWTFFSHTSTAVNWDFEKFQNRMDTIIAGKQATSTFPSVPSSTLREPSAVR
ncbi:hypothetical protein [Clostridium sp. AN503]|uniref:hypothetical protein n=1 Tax=Clostridium sp. AN503 TaxID=3160598 RepID=UPI00345A57C2